MNRKKSKKISKQSKLIMVEWLSSLLSKEEASKITTKNCLDFMPKQTHFMAERTIYLNAYHPKWIRNKIKTIIYKFPQTAIVDITLKDIQWISNKT